MYDSLLHADLEAIYKRCPGLRTLELCLAGTHTHIARTFLRDEHEHSLEELVNIVNSCSELQQITLFHFSVNKLKNRSFSTVLFSLCVSVVSSRLQNFFLNKKIKTGRPNIHHISQCTSSSQLPRPRRLRFLRQNV